MRVLVCIKQVPEPESPFELSGGRLSWQFPPKQRMGSFGQFALEEALLLKDAGQAAEVWALTVGPPEATAVLQRALGMGADRAVHLLAAAEPAPRPLALAHWIAAWAQAQNFDLILVGVISEDAMQGLVGPMLARLLGLPCATSVVRLTADPGSGKVRAQRELEGGRRQELELPLPALLTIQSSVKLPRYPRLSNLLRAKKTSPLTLDTAGLAQPPLRDKVVGLMQPQRRRDGLVLTGSTQEKAAQLRDILRQRALL